MKKVSLVMKKVSLILLSSWMMSFMPSIKVWQVETYGISFTISHAMGSTAKGKFSNLSYSIKFDANDLANSAITASVDASTLNTNNGSRDKTVKGKEYLDATTYPKISMASTKIVKEGTGYNGTFNITIKGRTKVVQVPFTMVEAAGKGVMKGSFKVNRLDFGVGESSMMLGDVLTASIVLNLK